MDYNARSGTGSQYVFWTVMIRVKNRIKLLFDGNNSTYIRFSFFCPFEHCQIVSVNQSLKTKCILEPENVFILTGKE